MPSAIIGFVIGVAWLQTQAQLPAQFQIALLAGLLLTLALLWRKLQLPILGVILRICSGAVAGFI